MSELFFVLKSLVFTVLLVFALQFQLGGSTLEKHFFNWVHHSAVGEFLANVAHGGTALVANGSKTLVDMASSGISGTQSVLESSKAGRFDFDKKNQPKKSHSNHED